MLDDSRPEILMPTTEISTGFIPRRLQLELRAKMRRFNVIVCHRR